MKHQFISLAGALCVIAFMTAPARSATQTAEFDLTQWKPPEISSVADDAFGVLVKYGYELVTNTANEIGPTVADQANRFAGNNLACANCHLQGGTQPYAMPWIGIWGQFPQYRAREGAVVTLADRINGCMERSMNGRALPLESREMKGLLAYMRWLSAGVPDGVRLVGGGTLQIKEPARAADPRRGAQVFSDMCAACHGASGLGQRAQTSAGYQFPPLWGPDSFNDGAGMSRLLTVAAYAMHNMPVGTTYTNPAITDDEAYDVAAYVTSQKRPGKANLDKDFPVRLQKPIDTPYGPYVDGFSLEQHKYGPFGPIRVRIQALATASGTAKAGEPDNGSVDSDHTR